MADASVAARKVENTQLPRVVPGTSAACGGPLPQGLHINKDWLVRTHGPAASRFPGSRSLPLAGGNAPPALSPVSSANQINRTNEADLPKNIAANCQWRTPSIHPQKLCETDQEDPASLARTRREEAHFHD